MTGSDDVVSFDVDATVEAIRGALDGEAGDVHAIAVYTPDAYELAYVDGVTRSFYDDDERMAAHFDRIHRYAGIDFSEIELFVDDLFPVAGGVEYIATGMEHLTVIRVYAGDEGVFVSAEPSIDPSAVVEAVREAVDVRLGAPGEGGSDDDGAPGDGGS